MPSAWSCVRIGQAGSGNPVGEARLAEFIATVSPSAPAVDPKSLRPRAAASLQSTDQPSSSSASLAVELLAPLED